MMKIQRILLVAGSALSLALSPVRAQTRLVALWDFETVESDGTTIKSAVGSYTGRIHGNAVVSGAGQGRPSGGKGFVMSPNTNKGQLLIEAVGDANPLNVAAVDDNITITFWQKNNSNPNASSFWAVADDADRSTQAEVPSPNGNIYWDTGGCCGGDTRLNTVPSDHNFNSWHLYSFVKRRGIKEIWIDGNLIITQDGYRPHSILNTKLLFGGIPSGNDIPDATIDDFAIWKGALKPHHIIQLASGVSPASLDLVSVVNLVPLAYPQSLVTYPGAPTLITLVGRDYDSDPLSYSVVTPPSKGVLSGTPPFLIYTPNSDSSGTDSFTFKVNDGLLDSAPATVSIDLQQLGSNSANTLVAWWDFEAAEADGVTLRSKVGGFAGRTVGSAGLTEDGSGRPGGGRGFDMSGSRQGHLLHESEAGDNPLNIAAAEDTITITFWQKNLSNRGSSSFWARAEDSAPSDQAVVPGSDGNIHWDTWGCCGNDARISVMPPGHDFSTWHQYSFVKRRSTKEIWIDGKLVKRQGGARPHSVLNTKLYIGHEWDFYPPDGIIDDFVIWRGALSPDQIGRLAAGSKPSELMADQDSDGLPDPWETQYGLNPGQPDGAADPDGDGYDNLAEYAMGTDPNDRTPPKLVGATTALSGRTITLDFSEKIDPVTGGDLANYSISPSVAVTGISVQRNRVTLTTEAQDQSGLEYTVSVSNVRDLSKNVIVAGSSVGTYAYKRISRQGALRFSIWRGIPGNELDRLLADPRYPSEPDAMLALGSFNTREQLPDSEVFAPERENYGARIDGYLTPTESGEYRFFISSDDQSQLFVSTDDTEAKLAPVAKVTSCCDPFTEPDSPQTSQAIPLVAGQRYFVRFLYKEGCCGDYGQVAWRKEGDATPAASLTPIPGSFLSTELLIDPQGTYSEISPRPDAVNVNPNAAIVIRHRDGTIPWTAENVSLKYDGQTVVPSITKQGDLLSIQYTPTVISPSGARHSVSLGYLDPQGRSATYQYEFRTLTYNRPVSVAQTVTTQEDAAVSITLTATDLDGDSLSYAVDTQPRKGTLTGSAPNLTYRPNANANGTDSFTFKVNDGVVDSEPVTVSIVIAPVDDAPIALAGDFQTPKNVAVPIRLGISDADIPGSFTVVEGDFTWQQARAAAEAQGGHLATFTSQEEWDLAKAVVGQRSLWIGAYQGENRVEPLGGWLWVTGEPWGFTAWGPGEPNNVGSEDFAHLIYTPMVNSPTWNDAPAFSFFTQGYLLEMPPTNSSPGLTITVVNGPSNGLLSGTPPNLTYTPRAGFIGSDAFTFRVGDGAVDSAPATVSISVLDVNAPPVAISVVRTNEWQMLYSPNGPLVVPLVVAGSDADGDPLTYWLVSAPEGSFVYQKIGTDRYVVNSFVDGAWDSSPPTGLLNEAQPKWYLRVRQTGTYRLQFYLRDGVADSPVANLDVVIVESPSVTSNQPPVAIAQAGTNSVIVIEDVAKAIVLAGVDVDGDALSYTVVTQPTKGVLSGTLPNLTYTPNANVHGSDSLTFAVNDGTSNSAAATVSISITPVNDVPVAVAGSINTAEDSPVAITLQGSDPDGDVVVYSIFTEPAKGVLSGTPPNLIYTPKTNASGADAFVFKLDDGALSSFATISINIAPINDPPVALPQTVTLSEDSTRTITLRGSDIDTTSALLVYTVLNQPTKGSLTGTNGVFTYRPNAHANGPDGFTFKVGDGSADSAPATVSIDITPVNDVPIASSQGVSTTEDSPVAVTLAGVDVDSDPLVFTIVSQPTNGSLSGTPPNLVYTPRTNFAGSDGFSFKISDGVVESPTNAVVSITVTPANDAPIAVAQSISTPKNTPRPILLAAADVENETLTYTVVAQPTRGALAGTAPALTYTPELNFVGDDSFTFRARDGSADSAVVTVSIRVVATNVAPVAVAQSLSVAEDTGVPVLLGATDADLDPLTFIVVAGPTKGTLSGTPPDLVYLPNTNAVGADTFTFLANDGAMDSAPATVSLTITAINDAPVAQSAIVSGPEDSAIPVLLAGLDADGDALNYTLVESPTHGSLVGTPPALSYIPPTNFHGTDSIRFKVRDGAVDSAVATVQLTVTPVNDPPILAPMAGSVLDAGVGLYFTASGSDIDLPAQTLTFSLKSGPAGMVVSPSGSVSWLPAGSQRPSTNTVVVELTDGGATVTGSFVVVAKEASLVANFEGSAIDGYIAGATLWFDADLDGVVDPGEPQTVTDRQGDFVLNFDASLFDKNLNGKLDPSEGRIVAEGGVDLSSGQPRVGQLTAPAGSSVITPLTTMVDLVSRDGTGLSVAVAEERVRSSLGIPAGISITSFDPVVAAVQGDQRAAAVQLAASTVADTVRLLSSVVDGSSAGVDAETSSEIVSQTLAKKMVSGAEVDLASPATVSSALGLAAAAAGTSVSVEIANAVSEVVADQNLAKESIVANAWNPLEALQSISQVQAVVQSSTANALGDLASGDVSTDEVLLVHTGNALNDAVAAAPVGDVTGTDRRPGIFTISTATAVVSEAGQFIQPLIIARQNGAFGSVLLQLRLEGDADLLKTNVVMVEFADAVTQRTVDLASVLRDDLDPQFDRQVSASLALAPNAPIGAALGSAVGASIRVVDNDSAGSIGFVASTFRASEAGEVTVELRRVDGSAGRIQAVVRLFGGSAAPGQDYTNSVITTEFLPGQTRKRVSLGWIDDATSETSETVSATIEIASGSAPGATLLTGSTEAEVTVDDNDAPNSAPVATGVDPGTDLTVVEGSSISMTLRGSDPEGSTLTFIPVGLPSKGALSGRSPNLTYKANLGARGTDSFTYKVNDGQLDSSLTTVTITIKPSNLAPTAISQVVNTDEGRAVGLRLAGTDPDGDALTYRITRVPSKGVLSGAGGDLVYTPNPRATGVDSFLFRASDSKDESPDQTVWVVIYDVNDAPVANNQTVSGAEDQPLVITLTGNDPENSALTYTLVQAPGKGVLSGTGSRVTYLPSTNYHGADVFTFRVSDGSLSSGLATVSVSIVPVNDAPEAFGQTLAAVVGTPAPIVLTGGDIEADPLRFTVVRPPAQGTLSGIPPNLSYTAASGARGVDSFTFKVGDGSLESTESTVEIRLIPENLAPNAVAQSVVVDEGTTRSILLAGVDSEGAPLVYSIASAPTKGSLSGTAPALVYTPAVGKTGADTFTFKVNDGFRDSAIAVVSLDIRENVAPTASVQSVTLAEDSTSSIALTGQDPEGKPLSYTVVVPPSKGELSGTAPNLTYTPLRDVSGSDSFTFRVNDGFKDSALASVSLTITEVNDAPVALGFSRESANRAPVTLQLLGKDVDSTVLTYSIVQEPKLGSLSGQAPNLVYTPRTNAFGTDSFTYTVSDGTATSEPAAVTIPIRLPVTVPVAVTQKLEAEDGVPLAIVLSGTDTSGSPLTYLVDRPTFGTLTASGPNVVYTAKPGFRGRDVFGFRVFNGARYSSSAFVEIDVVAKRDKPPVFNEIADAMLNEGQSLAFSVKAIDPEGAALVYSLVRGPSGLTVSPTGSVAWVPSEVQGPSTNLVIVGVDDGVNSATRRFTVVVREVNAAPVIDPLVAVSIDPLVAWTLPLAAKDSDLPAQRLVFGLVQGPEGLSVSDTGRMTWTPTAGQASKTHRVEVFVTDGTDRATAAFQVTVRAQNTAPFFSNLTARRIRELSATSFRLVGRDADLPAQQLSFGLVAGPKGLTVGTDGEVNWTPTEEQGPSTNRVVVRVSDNGVPALSTTNAFDIIVTEANLAPTFGNLTSRLIRELSPTSFRLAGRDSDLPAQLLTYALVNGPSGLTVSPDGVVTWTPTEEQGPSTNAVTVRVSDNGSPALSATSTFNLIVSEANTAPTLINAFSRSLFENVKLSSQLIARDADLPAQKLSFSLVSGPKGLTLSAGGLLEWTPSEDQGPSTNKVVVKVSDDAPAPASSTVTFVVTVRESNATPVFPTTNLTVAAQSKLAVALQATDSDLPVQTLSYRLEGGPAGLTLSTNGLLEWTPAANLANTTNVVRVSVTDSVARVQTTVRIVVGPVGSGGGAEAKTGMKALISLQVQQDQSMVLKVAGPAGSRFRVESQAGILGTWQTLGSIGIVQTLGEDEPLLIPIPAGELGEFRQFRLVKE